MMMSYLTPMMTSPMATATTEEETLKLKTLSSVSGRRYDIIMMQQECFSYTVCDLSAVDTLETAVSILINRESSFQGLLFSG